MSGISLDKFQQVRTDEKALLRDGDEPVTTKNHGNLFGKAISWLTRTEAKKTANNEVTKAFFDSLEKTYGKDVKDGAIQGYESRLDDGKPLSGYRIQQIMERAREGHEGLSLDRKTEIKKELFTEKMPQFLREALDEFDIPEDRREGWERTLRAMLPKQPELTELNPRQYDTEFRKLVSDLVDTHRVALESVGQLEARRQQLHGHEGYDWGSVRQSDLERYAFPPAGEKNYRDTFLKGFGRNDGQTDDIEVYFHQTVLPGAKTSFTRVFGESSPETMQSYDQARTHRQVVNNGNYHEYPKFDGDFVFVQRMDRGQQLLQEEQLRSEKFHISVRPEDMGRVFEALSPILGGEDCPIPMWKTVDVDLARQTVMELTPQRDLLLQAKQTNPEAFTEDQQKALDRLNRKIDDAQRLQDSCQITLYVDPDSKLEDGRVGTLLGEIERTLGELGIEPPGTPPSDERVGQFVSFRVGQVTYKPGEPGYEPAFGRNQHKTHGDPITERIDPFGEGYQQHKVKFGDNPTFRVGKVGVEIAELGRRLDALGILDQEERRQLLVDTLRMSSQIDQLDLPDEAKRHLNEALSDLIRRHAGLSDQSYDLIGRDPVGVEGFIDGIRTSTFDDLAKVHLEQLVSLSSRLMVAASNPETPLEDRLRMAGELDSLQLQIGSLLSSQRDNVDGDGQQLIRTLRAIPFKPDLGDLMDNYRLEDAPPPGNRGQQGEVLRQLGVALESLDRGLPLIPDEKEELTQLLTRLDTMMRGLQPTPGFEERANLLQAAIGRLRAAVEQQLGPPM
jgi:hypothetical protein